MAFIRMLDRSCNRSSSASRSSVASEPVSMSRALSRTSRSAISSRSSVVASASRTASAQLRTRCPARSHVRSTSLIGPKWANRSTEVARDRIRSMLSSASSRSKSGGGVAGRSTGRSGTWMPSASPVSTAPDPESTSATWWEAWPGVYRTSRSLLRNRIRSPSSTGLNRSRSTASTGPNHSAIRSSP